ncbi:VanW family protein [Candidatus Peregrinibacteria bacterium]|nr:MAG: VanW family protein [Candidatus Peregrinibacteria bacterium]
MKKKKHFPYRLAAALTTVALLALAVCVLFYQVNQLPESVFAQKTSVEALPESQFTTFAALQTATEAWVHQGLNQPIELQSERGQVPLTLAALGVSVDWTVLAPELKDFMSSASLLKKTSTYLFGQKLELPLLLNEEQLHLTLAQTGIEQGNKNAVFIWDGSVQIQAGQIGYGIEKEPLIAMLKSSFKSPQPPESFTLTLRSSSPEITEADLQALLPAAEELAQKSLTFQDEFGNTWELDFQSHLYLMIPSGKASPEPTWTLDQNGFITYAETVLVPEVEEEPSSVVITENADGTYSFEGSARFGKELDKLALHKQVLEKLITEPLDTPLTLPITTVDPSVTVPPSLTEKGVTGLVGLGYSDFSGSPYNRIHNIKTGIAQFNGVLIDQGAEFSFMGHLSPVDAGHGFLPELVIKGDETIPEYGGGLCQISSTLFRAALYSGLPITARRNHSYAVSYYARPFGYGLDATVYDPAPDLKFVNDTAGALLVQAYTEGNAAYYVFYGTYDARTVTMEGPYSYNYNTVGPQTTYTDKLAPGERELKEYSHTGFTTDWYRTVVYPVTEPGLDENGQPLYLSPYAAEASGVRELIHSVYEARPAKYWEGSAEGAEGAELTISPTDS